MLQLLVRVLVQHVVRDAWNATTRAMVGGRVIGFIEAQEELRYNTL